MIKKEKLLIIISSILSLAIIPPAIGLIFSILNVVSLLSYDSSEPDSIERALNYSLHEGMFKISLIFFAITFSLQMIISAFMIVKSSKKELNNLGKINLFFGGLFFSPIYSIYILNKNKFKSSKKYNFRILKNVLSITAVSPLIALPVVGLLIYQGVEKPTNSPPVYLSLNKKAPNVIEIFTDGFDPEYGKNAIKNKENEFKDFTMLNKYVVSGAETSYSYPTILNGMKENVFADYDKDTGNKSLVERSIAKFPNAINKHLTAGKVKRNPFLINISGIAGKGNYTQLNSGDESILKKINPDINQVNWAQAKKDVLGQVGAKNVSDQQFFFEWMFKKMKAYPKSISIDKQIGARVLLQDFITHAPRTTGRNGSLNFSNGVNSEHKDVAILRTANALANNLVKIMTSLKQIINPLTGMTAYDNSLILIYGDHSNHSRPLPHKNKGVENAKKYHSLAMVKYPFSNNGKNNSFKDFDKPFYAPFINNLITDFDNNKTTTFDNFIAKYKSNFKDDRNFLGFYGKSVAMMKFENDGKLYVDKSYSNAANKFQNGWLDYEDYKKLPIKTRNKNLINTVDWEVK